MELNCPECGAVMTKTHGYKKTKYTCPDCGHEVTREVGKKKHVMIRLYDHQKRAADIRGGVQFVVDTVLDDNEE